MKNVLGMKIEVKDTWIEMFRDSRDARRREEAAESEGNVTRNYLGWLTQVRSSFS